MGHLGVVLYEYLGEEYPEVLGSILGALKAIVNVIGMTQVNKLVNQFLMVHLLEVAPHPEHVACVSWVKGLPLD